MYPAEGTCYGLRIYPASNEEWQMTSDSEQREHKNFDREYGLSELLSTSVLDELCAEIQKAASVPVLVLLPDGTPYYTKGSLQQDEAASLSRILHQERIDTTKILRSPRGKITVFPITHELETIGYLVLGYEKDGDRSSCPVIPLGSLLLKVLNHLIAYKYKSMLTAGLHGQVVEESHEQLREKAALLEKSEQKYRRLAESLEIEVERKTKEIKETQAQFMQQEKMASVGQLAAGVAHEINNPMGFISSNLNTLEGYAKDLRSLIEEYRPLVSGIKEAMATEEGRPRVSEKLDHIVALEKEMDIDFILNDIPSLIKESEEGAERIKKIVADLKDFSHPGKKDPEYADINHNLDSTLNIVWNELKYKATVKKEYGDLPQVKCYPQQLNQVFVNLLVNAAQAIEKQGEINITTRVLDGKVEITISDTGSGIPEENLSRIFDPFFTTKEVGKGTGLGLNVAYNIIKKHKGTIDVQSEVGKGTTFTIRIPVDSH
jgi:two-component system NtrC family sensor kinase